MTIQRRAVLLCVGILLQLAFWMGDAAAEDYIERLRKEIVQCGNDLPTLTKSAERAAGKYLSGGNLWVAGRQADFIGEACGRAGGLMDIAPLGYHEPGSHDVILYATPGALNENDRKVLEDWHGKGVSVIRFCSPAGFCQNKFPIDTVVNVTELWMWTGEFVAACARSGKMPVLYQSYGLPGGRERAAKYQGKRFHDNLNVQPIAPGRLGQEYSRQVQAMLARIQRTQMPSINRAAEWWRKSKSATTLVTGHMFPAHVQDSRAIHVCDFVPVAAWEDKELLGTKPPEFVFYLGYQFAPQKLLDEAKKTPVKLVLTCVE